LKTRQARGQNHGMRFAIIASLTRGEKKVARLSHDVIIVMASDAPQPCESDIPVAKADKAVLPFFRPSHLWYPTFWNSLPYLRRTQITFDLTSCRLKLSRRTRKPPTSCGVATIVGLLIVAPFNSLNRFLAYLIDRSYLPRGLHNFFCQHARRRNSSIF
jgi:hypothetical protein